MEHDAGERGRVGAGVALVAGVVGLVVGLGVGAGHALKRDFSPVGVAGIVTLCTGVTLTTFATVKLVGRLHRWWRLVAVPIALAVVVFAVMPLTLAVYATNVPRTRVGSATPADRGLAYRDVSFTTTDGVRLSAWYVPSRNGAAVVAAHGAGETRSSLVRHASVLAHAGYGVLLFDARGHGRSGGTAMEFGWYGERDLDAAVSFVDAQPDVHDDRIAALGLSMGGEEAIGAAAHDHRIRAVVAEGATNRTYADRGWLPGGVTGAVQRAIDWVTYAAADLMTPASTPISLRAAVARIAPRPVLLVTAGKVADEQRAARFIRAASPDTVEIWRVPRADHTDAVSVDPDGWTARVLAFLDGPLR